VTYEVTVQSVTSRHIVAVRERRPWSRLGPALIPLLDRVYDAVRSKQVIQAGHNVFVFRPGTGSGATVDVGVEGRLVGEAPSGLLAVTTPAGDVATTPSPAPEDIGCAFRDEPCSSDTIRKPYSLGG
jgi:hypothetical protein